LAALQAAAATLQPAAELDDQLQLLQRLQEPEQQQSAGVLIQQQLAAWLQRWPAIYSSGSGGGVVRVLELRCKLLQTFQRLAGSGTSATFPHLLAGQRQLALPPSNCPMKHCWRACQSKTTWKMLDDAFVKPEWFACNEMVL